MEQELNQLDTPQKVLEWVETNDIIMNLSLEDTEILLSYMNDHDYSLLCDEKGQLYRKDICEESGETEEIMIDEVIDICCEWNYEDLLENDVARAECENFIDFCNRQSKYDNLKKDEILLDRMFDQTIYAKQIEELATDMANRFIAAYQKSPQELTMMVGEIKHELEKVR